MSPFDLEVELRDAETFGRLSEKTRERGAKVAYARVCELAGVLP